MKKIGILGGLGPESTIAYYAHITRAYHQLYKDFSYPDILIYSLSFTEFIENGYELPHRVKQAIDSLQSAGADFVVAACNSIHIVYDTVAKDISIPWLSIMDASAEQVKNAGIKKVGLLGTIFTMTNTFYPDTFQKSGIETILPDPNQQKQLNRIIYEELVTAKITDDSRQQVLKIIDSLNQKGAEGIVLGCTELPFLIRQKDTNLPVFDTTTIHAQKALDIALDDN